MARWGSKCSRLFCVEELIFKILNVRFTARFHLARWSFQNLARLSFKKPTWPSPPGRLAQPPHGAWNLHMSVRECSNLVSDAGLDHQIYVAKCLPNTLHIWEPCYFAILFYGFTWDIWPPGTGMHDRHWSWDLFRCLHNSIIWYISASYFHFSVELFVFRFQLSVLMGRPQRDQGFSIPGFPGRDFGKIPGSHKPVTISPCWMLVAKI